MQRVVFDTDLYIDWIEAGLHQELMCDRSLIRHMSTVVLLELQAGALTTASADAVSDLYKTFGRMGRLLVPSAETYWRAGSVVRTLQVRHRVNLRRAARLANDCLIALSARQIGATVLTRNVRDYKLIREVIPFAFIAVP
jgi:predicted nucleic acid-binding protein